MVRDPRGRRQDEACFCTDLTVDPPFILEGYARRWTLEVTYHDAKQWLGLEDPQNQTSQAVQRTAPMAFLVYDLILRWYAGRRGASAAPTWVQRPWYPQKTTPAFLAMLTALRCEGWQRARSGPAWPARRPQNAAAWRHAVLAAAKWRKSSLAVTRNSSIFCAMSDSIPIRDGPAALKPDRERLFEIAAEQGGYVTTAQARTAGFSWALRSHHAKRGRFVRIRRGLYRLRMDPSSPVRMCSPRG